MLPIAFGVLISVKAEQLVSISVVFVTFDISKDDRLSEVKTRQLENMHDISVTLLVLKFPKEIDVKFVSLFASNALLNTIFEIFHKKIDIFARLV